MRVEIRSLTADYNAPHGGALHALGPLSLEIDSGAFVALVGPSGCGKSTLVRILAGLQAASRGQVLLEGVPLDGPTTSVGVMFQTSSLMPWRTVLDNVALPLELAGMSRPERHEAARRILPILGLAEFEQAYPGELSGGMAQRAALGRVLIQRPDLLLLDEPFGALDAMTREKISFDLLRMWASFRQTVLMVTHDIREAVLLSDRVVVLSQRPGRLLADIPVPLPRPRSPNDVFTAPFGDIARQVREAIDRA